MLRIPELEAALQVGSHWSRLEGQNHLLQSDDDTAFDAAQDAVSAIACCGLISSFSPTSTLKSFSTGKLTIPSSPSLYWYRGLSHLGQHFALGLVGLHEIPMGSHFQLVQCPLDSILSFKHISHTTQLEVICRGSYLGPHQSCYATGDDNKPYWCPWVWWPQGNTTLWMRPANQFLFCQSPTIKSMSLI